MSVEIGDYVEHVEIPDALWVVTTRYVTQGASVTLPICNLIWSSTTCRRARGWDRRHSQPLTRSLLRPANEMLILALTADGKLDPA